MQGRNVRLIVCPYLGSWRDPETAHSYPTSRNCCYADPGNPRQISNDHQRDFCLADYDACPYFPAQILQERSLPKTERRRARRLGGGEVVAGQIRRPLQARVVDLSINGALVEHSERIRPGEFVELKVEAEGFEVTLPAGVVRSYVTRAAEQPGGRSIVYCSGCEFIGEPPVVLTRILSLLEARGDSGSAAPGALP